MKDGFLMSILFSIITPIYNSEKYLDKCILSILNQSYNNFELILIDDGSTDDSPSICDSYAKQDSRITVIHQNNSGQTVARKNGADVAKGEFIACIDSDDWIDKDYLLEFKKVIDKYDVDVICSGMKRIVGKNVITIPLPLRKGYYSKENIINEIYPILIHPSVGEGFSVCVWGKVIKRKLYQTYQSKVDKSLKMGEDLACLLPCVYNSNSIYVLKDCLYNYRDNPDSYTKKKPVYDWLGPLLIYNTLSRSIDINQFDFNDQLNRRILRELFLVVTSQFNKKTSYKEIKKEINYYLSNSTYKNVIVNGKFGFRFDRSSLRYRMYSFLLKNKMYFMIKLYNIYLFR